MVEAGAAVGVMLSIVAMSEISNITAIPAVIKYL